MNGVRNINKPHGHKLRSQAIRNQSPDQSETSVSKKRKAAGGSQSPREVMPVLLVSEKKPRINLSSHHSGTNSGQSEIQVEAEIVSTDRNLSPDQTQEFKSQEILRASLLEELKNLEELTSILKSGELKFMLDPSLDKRHVHFQSSDHEMRFGSIDSTGFKSGLIKVFVQDNKGTVSERERPVADFLPQYQEMEIIKSNPSLLLGHVEYHLDNMGSPEWQDLIDRYPIERYPHFYPTESDIDNVIKKLKDKVQNKNLDVLLQEVSSNKERFLQSLRSCNESFDQRTNDGYAILEDEIKSLDEAGKRTKVEEFEKTVLAKIKEESKSMRERIGFEEKNALSNIVKNISQLIYWRFIRNQGIHSFSSFQPEVQTKIRQIISEDKLNLLFRFVRTEVISQGNEGS